MMLITTDPYFQQGWFHFQSSLYYISPEEKTWSLSRDFCQQRGADLTTINSKAEQVGEALTISVERHPVQLGCSQNLTDDVMAGCIFINLSGFCGEIQEGHLDRTERSRK